MLNMDFSRRVVIETRAQAWQASPMAGVWRKPLAREGVEHGHATSIVRYDPGSAFSAHDHPRGEEILVLEGTFCDDSGAYPAGTYLRNPEGFRHAPYSAEGCLLLVKLAQFRPNDSAQVCIDSRTAPWLAGEGAAHVLPLHDHEGEQVRLVRCPAGATFWLQEQPGGEEIYVIGGELLDEHGRYPTGSWIRNPRGSGQAMHAQRDALVWVKTGHF